MVRLRKRRRRREDDLLHDHPSPKRIRSTDKYHGPVCLPELRNGSRSVINQIVVADTTHRRDHRHNPSAKKNWPSIEHLDSWQYPPEFWDRLSKVPLAEDALEEFDRQTLEIQPSFPLLGRTRSFAPTGAKELARFARHGGPDLCHLRGYSAKSNYRPASAMSSSGQRRAASSTDPTSVPTSGRSKSKNSKTPHSRGFDQHLTDHTVHATHQSEDPDLTVIRAAMAAPRPSLSPSRFSDGAFKNFQRSNAQAKDEEDARVHVFPTIAVAWQPDHPSAMNTLFGNLEPLTDGTIAPAKPDVYYGARPENLDRRIRDELSAHIIPSTMEDKPMAPNFFSEVKGPYGPPAVATLQARYDGAIGARATHSLQNYGRAEPIYDGKAYTISSTYHAGAGTLQMYAHHSTRPASPGRSQEYHMTQIGAWALTNASDTFRQGVTALRNAKEWTKEQRDRFIWAANTRVHGTGTEAPPAQEDDAIGVQQQDAGSSLEDFVDCEESAEELQDLRGVPHLRQGQADKDEEPSVPPCLHAEDDVQNQSQDSALSSILEPSMSFATSFTSSFSTTQTRSKRQSSQSSPSISRKNRRRGSGVDRSGWS